MLLVVRKLNVIDPKRNHREHLLFCIGLRDSLVRKCSSLIFENDEKALKFMYVILVYYYLGDVGRVVNCKEVFTLPRSVLISSMICFSGTSSNMARISSLESVFLFHCILEIKVNTA